MIPVTRLVRLEENFQYGTFGVFLINTEVFCVTLEPADLLNKPNEANIPEQQYLCRKIISPSHGKTFEVKNVPGRTHVLFHAGNTIDHTEGCILLGQYPGKLKGERAVLNSGATFKKFMERMEEYDTFHLTVNKNY